MTQDIRFLYLRDTRTDRVVTVARRLNAERTAVIFSFSVNRPTVRDRNRVTSVKGGDNFNKAMGRHIASARLEQGKSYEVELNDDTRPIEAILEFMAYDSNEIEGFPRVVRQIALDAYMNNMSGYMMVPVHSEMNSDNDGYID
jgi:hypothetical protein